MCRNFYIAQLNLAEDEKKWLTESLLPSAFHRASSQVEGRNGYLAFVHHANKGITEKRQKVLTAVH